jgi:cysteine desulfurase
MFANNETGVLQPIAEIGASATSTGCCSTPTRCRPSARSHRRRGDEHRPDEHQRPQDLRPQGRRRALRAARRPRVRLAPQIHGGGHERGNRSGTLNVPGIVGFGERRSSLARPMARRGRAHPRLRDRLRDPLRRGRQRLPQRLLGRRAPPAQPQRQLRVRRGRGSADGAQGRGVSSGSACTSASLEPSYVLRAIGIGEELAHTSIRLDLGRFTTDEEVDYVVKLIVKTRCAPARDVAAVGDGPGRHRPQEHRMERAH